jgi:hypothetical protein
MALTASKYNNLSSLRDSQKIAGLMIEISELTKELENLKAGKRTRKKITNDSQGTARQIALAFYYMRNSELIPRQSGTNTIDAEFIQFLSGKDIDKIRKNLKDPKSVRRKEISGKATKELIHDLIVLKSHFEKIFFTKGIEKIDNDILALQKDLPSYDSASI